MIHLAAFSSHSHLNPHLCFLLFPLHLATFCPHFPFSPRPRSKSGPLSIAPTLALYSDYGSPLSRTDLHLSSRPFVLFLSIFWSYVFLMLPVLGGHLLA
ncbi:hypothetical protein F5Y08DRAFT_276814 [Xylaria arbuscula]|nr:hypothetical protein F5Y08DRAFT_276814 [Xylaria arbuscula]